MNLLITDIADLKALAPHVHKNSDYNVWRSYIHDATIAYIIPAIGQAQYDAFEAGSLSSTEEKALDLIKRSLAYYAVATGYPLLIAQVGNAGVLESQTQQTTQARQWVFNEQMRAMISKADNYLDAALAFMEDNVAFFTDWEESEAYTVYKEFFIQDASQLNRHVNIQNSRSTFQRIRPYLLVAESRYIRPALGASFMKHLKTKLKANTLTADEKELLTDYIRPALAYAAISEGLPDLNITLTSNGFRTVTFMDGNVSKLNTSDRDLRAFLDRMRANMQSYLADLTAYLEANLATFAEYTSTSTNPPQRDLYDNEDRKSFMV